MDQQGFGSPLHVPLFTVVRISLSHYLAGFSAPPVARWTASRDANDDYDDYDDPAASVPSSASKPPPPGQWASPPPVARLAGAQDSTPLPSSKHQATPPPPSSSGKLGTDELPVLVKCDNGEEILHFSELFAPPRHELERSGDES